MNERPAPAPPWGLAAEEVLRQVGSDAVRGLSASEAAARLAGSGPNELPSVRATPAWALLLGQFRNVLVVILLVAIVFSMALGHAVEAAAIGAIALFSVTLGFVQEVRAEKAMEALRRLAAPDATVIRDGSAREVPGREVVLGDVILVSTGDVVPADARILETFNLHADEAALTGESAPAGKQAAALPAGEVALGDRKNMLFSSTAVTRGRGRAVVVATGASTEVGRIGKLLASVRSAPTPLEEDLSRVGRRLAQGAGGVVVLVIALGILRGNALLEMVLFGIALAVAVVPEALPAVVTISLALGARRMAGRNALVRRLSTVETLGSTTVICSDKTGTLTTGEMTVREVWMAGRTFEVTGAGYEPRGAFRERGKETTPEAPLRTLLEAGALCNDAELVLDSGSGRWRVKGDPTEGALVVAAAKAGVNRTALDLLLPRISEIPFASERKRMTTLHRSAEGALALSKGAPEVVVTSCARWLAPEGERPLEAGSAEGILSASRGMGERALRVLAIARGPGAVVETAESDMTLLGLVGMIDPPRPEAREAIESCRRAGIRPVLITGDHPLTARAIASELGLLRGGEVAVGMDLDRMDERELEERVARIDVYARVSPEHKLRVVGALQRRGEVVAMTGDGVNDAPALKKADIGISMGIAGTDVAKDAAGMTLTDDNFASIVAAVEEGRAIVDNVRKYLMYLLSSNVGEIALMALAVALGLPLPLTAVQILYVNLATDGLPALALAVDPHAPDLMRRRPRKVGQGLLGRPVAILMILGGLWSAFVNLSLFAWALGSGRPLAQAVTMTFVSLVLIQFFKAYSFRSDRESIFKGAFANRWLNRAVLWEVLLLVLVVYLPALQAPFGTFPLPVLDLAVSGLAALTVVPALELAKAMERRGWFGPLE
ncbi:MAG TPA: cation-translocating P-type ATPase [Planctomycetota bacterium]|nr:cation-translocating P-type ATPase [Planctomycetota bacterium]